MKKNTKPAANKTRFEERLQNWYCGVTKKLAEASKLKLDNDAWPEGLSLSKLGVEYQYTIPGISVSGKIVADRNLLVITQHDTETGSEGTTAYRLNAPAVLGMRIRNTHGDEHMLAFVYKNGQEDTLPVPMPAKVAKHFLQHYMRLVVNKTDMRSSAVAAKP